MNDKNQNNKKKHHFVPQNYLKRFTGDGKYLYVYDKTQNQVHRNNVVDVAQKRYFNKLEPGSITTPSGENLEPMLVEDILSALESNFNKTIAEMLISIKDGAITQQQKEKMSAFLVLQWIRTRSIRRQIIDISQKATQHLINVMVEKNYPETPSNSFPIAEVESQVEAALHAKMIFDPVNNKVASHLYRHIWWVGVNETEHTFYTSDNPVVVFTHAVHQQYEGLGTRGVEVAFPLSPKYVLILYERSFWPKFEEYELQTISLNRKSVAYYNMLQVCQSYQQVFCQSEDFDLTARVCRDHPEVCDLNRETVAVKDMGMNHMGVFVSRPSKDCDWILDELENER